MGATGRITWGFSPDSVNSSRQGIPSFTHLYIFMVFWLRMKPWGLVQTDWESFMCTFLCVGLHVSIHSCKELFKTTSQVWSCGTSCSLNRSRHRDYLHNEFTTLLPARACWRWYTEIDLCVCVREREWMSVCEREKEPWIILYRWSAKVFDTSL